MSIAPSQSLTVADYVKSIAEAHPAEAVKIALAEVERNRAIADRVQADQRALSEVEFDSDGRIAQANMAGLFRLGTAYSRTQLVPEHFRGKPDDCFIACQLAFRMKVDPLMLMQHSFVVHGKPGFDAQFAIALLNSSGKIKGRIRYKREGEGKAGKCTAFATDALSGEEVSASVDWPMVEAEGWSKKAGSKWLTMPDVMFHYRAAVFLIRRFYPEALMGMPTVDELDDTAANQEFSRPTPRKLSELTERLNGASVDAAGADAGTGANGMAPGEVPLDTPDEPETTTPGVSNAIVAEISQAVSIGAVNAIDEREKNNAVSALCGSRIEEIRANRGERAKQKEAFDNGQEGVGQ